jgi:hypothetical protein
MADAISIYCEKRFSNMKILNLTNLKTLFDVYREPSFWVLKITTGNFHKIKIQAPTPCQVAISIAKKGESRSKKPPPPPAQGIGGVRSSPGALRRGRSDSGAPESPVSGARRRKCAQISFKNLRNA